nr:hypothetical protein [Rhodococcus sp. UFZ-B548]
MDESVDFEGPHGLGEHLVADTLDVRTQLIKAVRSSTERRQDENPHFAVM